MRARIRTTSYPYGRPMVSDDFGGVRGTGYEIGPSPRPFFSVPPRSYGGGREGGHMRISCDECAMQHSTACKDCVVTYLLRQTAGPVDIDADEAEALGRMASVGLLPPLRLVRREATG